MLSTSIAAPEPHRTASFSLLKSEPHQNVSYRKESPPATEPHHFSLSNQEPKPESHQNDTSPQHYLLPYTDCMNSTSAWLCYVKWSRTASLKLDIEQPFNHLPTIYRTKARLCTVYIGYYFANAAQDIRYNFFELPEATSLDLNTPFL
jgi:hypothetical protein